MAVLRNIEMEIIKQQLKCGKEPENSLYPSPPLSSVSLCMVQFPTVRCGPEEDDVLSNILSKGQQKPKAITIIIIIKL